MTDCGVAHHLGTALLASGRATRLAGGSRQGVQAGKTAPGYPSDYRMKLPEYPASHHR